MTQPAAPWRIGVDVGGTFTDMVLADANGTIHTFKVPSVPSDPSEGVMRVVQAATDASELTLRSLLESCNLFVHGSTVATNTMLEGQGATVGLLTTRGFRDSLEIRRGFRENQWDHRRPFPPVLVPRYLRLPVGGRIDRYGDEIEPFNAEDVKTAIQEFKAERVEAIAVALINSFLNPVHEQACAELIRDLWDGNPDLISLSNEIMPIMGEYERTSTTVVNAYLAPRVVPYLKRIERAFGRTRTRAPIPAGTEQRRHDIGGTPVQPPREPFAIRTGSRSWRAECVPRGLGDGRPHLHGDRRNQLRRDADGAGRGLGSRRTHGGGVPRRLAVGGYSHHRRRRWHHLRRR